MFPCFLSFVQVKRTQFQPLVVTIHVVTVAGRHSLCFILHRSNISAKRVIIKLDGGVKAGQYHDVIVIGNIVLVADIARTIGGFVNQPGGDKPGLRTYTEDNSADKFRACPVVFL